jgi:hypothetical protein
VASAARLARKCAPICAAMSNVMPSLTPLLPPGTNGRYGQSSAA